MAWVEHSFEGAPDFSYELSEGDRRVKVFRDTGGNYELVLHHDTTRRYGDGGKWYFEFDVTEMNFLTPGPSQNISRGAGFHNIDFDGGVSFACGPEEGFVDDDVVGVSIDFDANEFKGYRNGSLVTTIDLETEAPDLIVDPDDLWTPVLIMSAIES